MKTEGTGREKRPIYMVNTFGYVTRLRRSAAG